MTLVQHIRKVLISLLGLVMVFIGAGALVTMPKSVFLQAGNKADVVAATPRALIGPAPDSQG